MPIRMAQDTLGAAAAGRGERPPPTRAVVAVVGSSSPQPGTSITGTRASTTERRTVRARPSSSRCDHPRAMRSAPSALGHLDDVLLGAPARTSSRTPGAVTCRDRNSSPQALSACDLLVPVRRRRSRAEDVQDDEVHAGAAAQLDRVLDRVRRTRATRRAARARGRSVRGRRAGRAAAARAVWCLAHDAPGRGSRSASAATTADQHVRTRQRLAAPHEPRRPAPARDGELAHLRARTSDGDGRGDATSARRRASSATAATTSGMSHRSLHRWAGLARAASTRAPTRPARVDPPPPRPAGRRRRRAPARRRRGRGRAGPGTGTAAPGSSTAGQHGVEQQRAPLRTRAPRKPRSIACHTPPSVPRCSPAAVMPCWSPRSMSSAWRSRCQRVVRRARLGPAATPRWPGDSDDPWAVRGP